MKYILILFTLIFITVVESGASESDLLPGDWVRKNVGLYINDIAVTNSSVWIMSYNECKKFDKSSKNLYDSFSSPNMTIGEIAAYSDEEIYLTLDGFYELTFMKYNGRSWLESGRITSALCSTNIITALTFDPQGRLWFCQCGNGEPMVKTGLGYSPAFSVCCIYFASDDRVWMGGRLLARSKIPYYESFNDSNDPLDDWEFISPPEEIYGFTSIAEDTNGDMLFGTNFSYSNEYTIYGVARYDGENWSRYTTDDGLPNNIVYDIEVDEKGTIWVSTGKGISCYYKDRWINYRIIDNTYLDQALIEIDNDGVVWIGVGVSLFSFIYDETLSVMKEEHVSREISLSSACPNPFNPSTTIEFSISSPSDVKLTVYSVSGQKVATLADGFMSAGKHTVVFDGSDLASGLYFYRIQAGGIIKTGKMMLVR